MRRTAVLVAFLATGALAVPTGGRWDAKCAETCETPYGDGAHVTFQPGKTHVYDYSADVVTTLSGATDEESRLHVTATAEVTANTPCDLTLQLRDIRLQDSDPRDSSNKQDVDNMATFKQELERWPLHFSYKNGRVQQLCANPEEPVWVMNFKRGVLSTLVTITDIKPATGVSSMEEDVNGWCEAEYNITQHGSSLFVAKEKNLLACGGRGHLVSSLQSTPYMYRSSDVQSLPLLKSTMACEQKISEDRLLVAECRESHLFKPFSQGENGAVTRTRVRLTERTVRNAGKWWWQSDEEDMPTKVTTMLFDHTDAELTLQNRVPAAAQLLAELQQKTSDDVRPDVPRLFTRLVSMLRHFNEDGLAQLDAQLESGSAAKRYFVDALPLAGTAPALAMMRDMILSGSVNDETTDRWMTSLAFVHDPDVNMVASMAPLLEDRNARCQTLLGVSSLVHHFCKINGNCANETPVRTVVSELERALGSGCHAASEDQEMRILTALKALGNAGRLVGGVDKLRTCFEDEDNSMEIRLAAIHAFRRMPCSAVTDSNLMATFANTGEDTEVRVAAYLAVMQCPSYNIVDKVQEVLSTETVNQVSSFVWSHLTNMQETNDPTKSYMKSLLYNLDLASKFNTDMRKFSRYFEKTMFSESMNAGATVDANVIFTPDSYMPRSGMFNLTVDLFGEAFNLLEIGGRVEGLEDFSESLFGDNGIYPQETISQIMKTMRGNQNSRIQSPKASAYVKIFGNELQFGKYDSLKELVASMGAKNPLDFLQKLAKDMDWTENYQFLDSSYTIPTITGFPFTLKATGTATLSLKTGGSFDVQSWNKINIDGHIKPSAAVEIMSEMLVDAHVAHTGLKMNTNLHTSTLLDGHAIVDGGKLVSVRVNMPRDKVEILDVHTRFHSVFRNRARKLEMHADNRYELKSCSDKYISTELLGISLCADVSYSRGTPDRPSCFFSGPLTARFTVEKTDTIKAFELEYQHSNENGIRKSNFVLDTVGSSIDRRITVDYAVDFNKNEFKAGFYTPIKSMDVSGVLDLAGRTKRADVSLKMDGRELFGVTSSLAIEDTPVIFRYSPYLNIRGPGVELGTFQGSLVANKNKHKYSADLTITKIFQTPVVLKGSLNEVDGTYMATTSMKSYVLDSEMKGTFRMAGDNLLIQANTKYTFLNGQPQTIDINSKMSKNEGDIEKISRLFVDAKFSELPMLNSQLRAEYRVRNEDGTAQATAVLIRGDRTYKTSAEMEISRGKVAGSIGFVAQHWDIDFKLGGGADFSTENKVVVTADAQLNKNYFAKTKVGVDYKNEPDGFNYGVVAELALPTSTYSVNTGVRFEGHSGHLRISGKQESNEAVNEVALVGGLSLSGEEVGGELTFSMPYYPRYELSARLVPGTGGLYMARVVAQAGQRAYTLAGELKLAHIPIELDLLFERPGGKRMSARVTALVVGDRPEVTVDLRFGRRITAALAGNFYPSENTGSFEIFWNKDVDDTEKASVEILLRDVDLSASLKYPGREIKLNGGLNSEGWTGDLQYAPGKVIRASGNIPVDGSFFSVNVDTPIEGFTAMSLTYTRKPPFGDRELNFEVVGRIEEQEARLVGHGKLDPAIDIKLELFTPLGGWEKSMLSFHAQGLYFGFDVQVVAAKNDDKFALGGRFEMHPEVFPIHTAWQLELPTDHFRKGRIAFDLEFGETTLETRALVQWKTRQEHEISLTLNSQHAFGPENHIDSVLTLHTPFEGFETLSSHLKFDDGRYNLNALFNVKHADTKIFNVEATQTMDFSAYNNKHTHRYSFYCAKLPSLEATLQFNDYATSIAGSISSVWRGKETSLSFKSENSLERPLVTSGYEIVLVLPIEPSRYSIKYSREMNIEEWRVSDHLELEWGSKKVVADTDLNINIKQNDDATLITTKIVGNGKLTTPFRGWKSVTMSHTSKMTQKPPVDGNIGEISYKGRTVYENSDRKTIEIADTMELQDGLNWHARREIASESEWVTPATYEIRMSGKPTSIQLTIDSERNDETARLEYSHDLGDISFSDIQVSLSGHWFGGVTRGVKVAVRNAAEVFYPSLDVTYDEDKTIRIYGSVTKNQQKGQSSFTLEAPFTERAVLSASHDLDKRKFTVDYLHGEKRYTIDMDVTIKHHWSSDAKLAIKYSSPRNCMGEGSILFKYDLEDELKLKGVITHNEQNLSMKSSLGMDKGHFTVNTPYYGYTELSASYLCQGDDGEIRLKREDDQILMVFSRAFSPDALTYNMRVSTPYSGYETMTLTINQYLGQDKFTAEYQRGQYTTISLTTKYSISGPFFWISAEAQSSLEGFSTSALHLKYDMIRQEAKFELSKEDKKIETEVVARLSPMSSEISVEYLNTLVDLGLPERLNVTGSYALGASWSSLALAVLKGSEKFLLSAEAQAMHADYFVTVNIATPIDGYESARFDARYGWTREKIMAKLELSKNAQIFKLILDGKIDDFSTASISLHTPYEGYRLARLTAEFDTRAVLSDYLTLIAERNSDKYEIKATMEETEKDTLLITLTTPFEGFEKLSVEGGTYEIGDEKTAQFVLTRNQDEIRVVLKKEFSWVKSKVSLEVTTPFEDARSLGMSAMYDLQNEQKTCQVTFARNGQQYGVKVLTVMKIGAATGFIEFNTPITGWENVKYQAIYDLNTDEKMMEISYERNGVKEVIAVRGAYDEETAYIDAITPLEGYETMGLRGRYARGRDKREAGYDAHVNGHRHRLHVLYERKGLESAVLKIETPIEGMHLLQIDARSEEFPDGAGYYINTNRDGNRNSIDIRTVKDDNSIGVDIGIKSYLDGLENVRLSGNVVTRGRKRSFSLKSSGGYNEAEVSGEIVMKKNSGNGKLKVALPIRGWEDVDASFDYKLGQRKSFSLTSTRGGVTREYSGTLQYTDSSIAVTLNTPFNGFKRLSADASRTEGPDGTISATVKLMRGNRKIEINYDYKFSRASGSAHIKAITPYDDFRTMETSVKYNVGANSRSFDFEARRDARRWQLQTTREWERGTDSGSLLLKTPLDELREVKFTRAFNIKNLNAMTYDAAYERNGRKFSLSGTGSIKPEGKKANFDVTVTTPLEIGNLGGKVDYDFAAKPRTINAKLNAGERHATLTASFGEDAGSINLITTNALLPKVDITYTADVSENKRQVQASLTLYDGRKLELDYLADYTKRNKANGHIYVKSTTYGDRKLIWNYAVPKDDFSGRLKYTSPNGNLDWSATVDGKQYVQRKIVLKSKIESEIYTSTWTATIRYNTKNGFNTKNKLVYNGKTYSLNFDAKEDDGKRKVSLIYNGQLLKGIKIDGTWTLPSNRNPRKEFDIKYQRGSRAASLKGWFQVSPGGKSGSADVTVETPFELVNTLHLKTSWDMVLPNRIIKFDYNRNNDRTFSINFVGSRQGEPGKQHGQYSLSVTTPPIEIRPGVTVSEFSWEAAFDHRYGHMYKFATTSPSEEELKIDVKTTADTRTVDVHYRFNDPKRLFTHLPPYILIDFNSKRTNRPVGPKIDLGLTTSFEGFENIEATIDITRGRPKSTAKINYRRGNRRAELTAEVEMSRTGGNINFNVQTPFEGYEQASLSGSYSKAPNYGLTLDYSRGDKFVKITTSLNINKEESYGQLQSGSAEGRFKLDSFITRPMDLLVTLDGSMEAQPRRSGQFKLVATLNGKTFSVDHRVSRAEAGRRTARMVILTPFKYPFKRITYNGDISMPSNKAVFSLEYGKKKIELDANWFTGEGRQYGAEIRLNTPFKIIQAVELDAKATVHPREDVADVLVHYRRNQKMVHVTGTVEPYAVDLHFETPTFGNFGVKGGFTYDLGTYKVETFLSYPEGESIGASVAVKPSFDTNNMQFTVDIHTNVPGFERLNVDIAYTNIENRNVMRVAFESPMTRRLELSFELTNLSDPNSGFTDFRAGVTTNYLGNAFTFKTSILRDSRGMKYELEIESPFHVLPSFKITGRR